MVSLLDFSEKVHKLYLVRHGATEATDKGLICGHMDLDLSPEGLEQAEIVGDYLSQFTLDAIFTSPLKRATQTANILAKFVKHSTFYKHTGLVEKSEGEWEGKTYWEIRDENSKLWEKWSKDPINFAPPGGENVKDFVAKVGRAVSDIRANYEEMGKNLVLVTHAGVIKAIIMNALNIPIENFFRIDIPPGSISRVDWSDNFASLKFCGLEPAEHEAAVI